MIAELESLGARVVAIYSGGLDFSGPVEEYLYDSSGKSIVDTVINLTGFALVGGPDSQDHKKAAAVLKKHSMGCHSLEVPEPVMVLR